MAHIRASNSHKQEKANTQGHRSYAATTRAAAAAAAAAAAEEGGGVQAAKETTESTEAQQRSASTKQNYVASHDGSIETFEAQGWIFGTTESGCCGQPTL